jgi:hypothetical protein
MDTEHFIIALLTVCTPLFGLWFDTKKTNRLLSAMIKRLVGHEEANDKQFKEIWTTVGVVQIRLDAVERKVETK